MILTGHNGYVGRHLLPMLARSHVVHGFDVSPGDHVTDTHTSLEQEESDREKYFARFNTLRHRDDADVVIHVGGIADSAAERSDIYFWNTATTQEWVNWLKPNQLFIYFSSCMADVPFTHYGWSKRLAEGYIRASNINHVILRPFNIYGGDEALNRLSVPRRIADRSLKMVFNDIVRDYIHVEDVCGAVIRILNSYEGSGRKSIKKVYDVGTGVGRKPSEIADAVGWKRTSVRSVDVLKGKPLAKEFVANPPISYFNFTHDVIEWCRQGGNPNGESKQLEDSPSSRPTSSNKDKPDGVSSPDPNRSGSGMQS